jgi:hypothetical protein
MLEDVLGEKFAKNATLRRDGWSAYPVYHPRLEKCWAHLLWEAEFVADRYDEAQQLCEGHCLVEHLLNWRSIIYGLIRPVMIAVMPEAT